jgi:hypothetical protein
MCSPILSLTSALDGGGGGQRHALSVLPLGKRPATHCTGDWVGPRAGLDGCGKYRLHTEIPSPDLPVRSESLNRLSYPGLVIQYRHLNVLLTYSIQ